MSQGQVIWGENTVFKLNDTLAGKDWSDLNFDEAEQELSHVINEPEFWAELKAKRSTRQFRESAIRIGNGIMLVYQTRAHETAEAVDTTVQLITRNEDGSSKVSLAIGNISPDKIGIACDEDDLPLIETFLDLWTERQLDA